MTRTTHPQVDITIIGGGPTGLFALFYAGMRGVTAQIVDALPLNASGKVLKFELRERAKSAIT